LNTCPRTAGGTWRWRRAIVPEQAGPLDHAGERDEQKADEERLGQRPQQR
jgi:hypothetical protein